MTFVQSVAETGAGFGAAFVYIIHSFVGLAIARSGTPEQKEHYLLKMADRDISVAFALTEPEAGFDTLSMNTTGERDGDECVIDGEKTYITGAKWADLILLIARTTLLEEVEKRSKNSISSSASSNSARFNFISSDRSRTFPTLC